MATTAHNIDGKATQGRRTGIFAAIGRAMDAYMERHARTAEIRRLDAMSDEQLAKMGISRDRIPHHVFRDMFYV